MDREIKMIGFDLDGTLLDSEKKITDYTRDVLKRTIEKGVVVLPATGRPMTGIPKELREFPGIRYAVTANGARIIDHGDQDKVIWERLLDYETAEKILTIAKEYDTVKEVCFGGKGYAEDSEIEKLIEYLENPAMVRYIQTTRKRIKSLDDVMESHRGEPVDKLHFIFRDKAVQKELRARLEDFDGLELSNALGNNLEVNAPGVHKGNGLIKLGEMLGIRREEIMAFGDGSNDQKMIETVGFGVAMENAIPELKAAADYITLSNDEDGVAKAIEKFVL